MRTDVERGTVTVAATPMQEALWWVHQRARNKSVYNITWRLTCDRPVDLDALGTAWQALVDRHEALRTSMVRPDDAVQMVVRPAVRARLRRVDVADAGPADPDELLRLIAEEAQEQETALDGETLGRLTAVRVGDRHELLLTVHHLVLDGWGMQLLTEELSTAYAAAVAGREPEFAGEPVPFRVYAAEQHDETVRAGWAKSLDYWRDRLEGTVATTVTAATTDGEFIPGAPGMVIRHSFGERACAGVATLAARTFAMPFAVFQGAMHIVLVRGGGGPDVAIGAVLANRMSERDQALMGYTANLCISRATVSGTDRVVDVVTRARDNVWAMLTHQAVPYPVVFNVLSEETRRTLTEDSPMGLSHLGPIGTGLSLGDVGLTLQPSPNRAARADISISTWEADGRYHAEIEFNTSRYTLETVRRLLDDMDAVLAAGGEDPDRVVGTIDVRSRAAVALVDHAQPMPEAAPDELPGSAAWRTVGEVWERLLGAPPAGPDVNFFAAGGFSLALLRLAGELETATGLPVDVVDWLADPTPRRLVAQLDEDAPTGPAGSTLVRVRDGEPGARHVHLLHGAGGGPADFQDLAAALPEQWRVTASREQDALGSVPEMAARYRADLDAAGLRPDILCGWSMGGLVAYEMASTDPGRPTLALLDSPPPVGYEPGPEAERFATFAGAFMGSVGATADSVPRTVGDAAFRTRTLAAALAALGHAVTAGVLDERWQAYDRHARMGEAYVGPARVPVPALVVGADQDDDALRNWTDRLESPRDLRVDADHYGILRDQIAAQVAAEIVRYASTQT